ncbi:MAG: thrombospondin type 3 repeat-containing protein [bacterium]|nr:thrombospondin type 3 repeat-containing protein [bacterium]
MGQILQNWRILVSASLSIALIVGAFLLARSVESPNSAQASTESALLQAIATKDSDGDGLTDWEEALYGTSPNTTDTFNLSMTDGEAVAKGLIVPKAIADISIATSSPLMPSDGSLPPASAEGTLTDTFAKNFFTLYLSAKQTNGGADLSENEMADIANEALNALSSAVVTAPDFKSAKDLKISGSGADALKKFAVDAESVFLKNTSDASKSEILYLIDAVENNNTEALTHIASISKAYRDSAVGLSALPVPTELSGSVFMLINAMMRVSEITADFSRVNTDPLTAMLALKQYVPAAQSLGKAFTNINNVYSFAGIVFPSGTPGSLFVNL